MQLMHGSFAVASGCNVRREREGGGGEDTHQDTAGKDTSKKLPFPA